MFRRVVCLLLLPCMLLTQSAAMLGHAHAGLRLPGHDLRPHFHTQPVPAGHDQDRSHAHGLHHGPGGHHHHHDDTTYASEPDSQRTPLPELPSDHDFDAVYVTSVDVVVAVRCVLDDGADTSPFWATAAAINFVGLWPNPSLHSAKERHPPPPTGSSCPLYVLHLTLLI